MIPTLESDRLVFRGHRVSDWPDCVRLWSDPQVVRFIGGRVFTPEEVWARVLRYAGHWALLGFGFWVVHEKATGAFVGEAGLADYRRSILPALKSPEVGWALVPGAQGRGLATEAVRTVLAWAEANGHPRTQCLIDPSNLASIRVAEKVGFGAPVASTYLGGPSSVFTRG